MSMKHILKQFALASLLATATLMAQTPYDEGQKALRDQRWMEAAEQFELAIDSDREQADSATYWRAYALFKGGRNQEAERELRRLERKYPGSRWVREGQALRIEHQGSTRSIEQVATDDALMDDELRLFALAQLMEKDPERAMPLLLDLVHNADSQKIRRDALFVLAMSEKPEALQTLADVARDSGDPELQVSAIQMLGAASTESSLPLLTEFYTGTASSEVKRAVIHAHIASDEPAPLVKLFESETDLELRKDIIHALGAMEATEELQALYPSLQERELRIATVEALSIAGDSALLKQVLDSETDPEIRRAALFGIAMHGGSETVPYLESRYESAQGSEEKNNILQALMMMDEANDLAIRIIGSESDPELKRQAIHVLGINEGTEELMDLYQSSEDPNTRKDIIEAMSIADDSQGLIRILESEQDQELRIAAIRYLGVTDNEDARQALEGLYSNGSKQEKSAIIESMMIMDDPKGLIELMKQEDDPELKRQMLQMLTLMDSDEADRYLFDQLESKQ